MLHAWIENEKLAVQNEGLGGKFRVEITTISVQHMGFYDVEIQTDEVVYLDLQYSNFYARDIKHGVKVRIYSDGKIVHEQFLYKTYDKVWVLLSNEKFEPVIKTVLDGLCKYSKYPILHYSIEYHADFSRYPNVENRFMKVDDYNDGQVMQFMKSRVFLDVLDSGVKDAIFLDADIQVRPNIDNLWDFPSLTNGPTFQKSYWDYTLVAGKYVPAENVQRIMGFEGDKFQKAPHGITNMVRFNQTHKDLFTQWEKLCFSDEIQEARKVEFLHDELLLNCLCWKLGYEPNLIYVALNVLTEKDVKFFYQSPNFKGTPYFDYNKLALGQVYQSFEPYNKEDICFFHCVKDVETATKINKIIEEEEILKNGDDEFFKKKLIDFYTNISKSENRIMKTKAEFVPSYINGASVTIRNGGLNTYNVKFIDRNTGNEVYSASLKNNYWAKTALTYYVPWLIQVDDGEKLHNIEMDFKGKRVYIAIDSKALGDTIAWLPYVEEFKKKHGCHVTTSTFHNDLFKGQYPDIEFVDPGKVVPNLYAQYTIGWFYAGDDGEEINLNRTPNDFKPQAMQKTAADILGLEYKEIKTRIWTDKFVKYDPSKEKQVTIAIHGTAQAKYWNNLEGWQTVVDYLKGRGYKVKLLSTEPSTYMGSNPHPLGIEQHPKGPLKNVIKELQKSELFIGIGSGLSWLAWAVGTPTVLISGFSEPYTEPQQGVIRVGTPEGKCTGCFNKMRLDAGDWNWCPMLKGTDRQFECTKSITGEMVIEKIKGMLKN
jgi:autotransporter strand-loop-strand O-heptosyltransferase